MTNQDYLILGIIAGVVLLSVALRFWDRYRKKKTWHRARAAEKKAIGLLEKRGYQVIEVHPRKDISYSVNGERKRSYVKADLLVRRFFRKVVVEIKTGEKTRVSQALIRRQLLDYYYAYGVQEVLLVEMDRECFDRIRFSGSRAWKKWLLTVLLLGIFILIAYNTEGIKGLWGRIF